jgi:hypothetical protein
VRFVVDEMALGQVFLLVFRFCLVIVISLVHLPRLHLPVALTETTDIPRRGDLSKSNAVSENAVRLIEKYSVRAGKCHCT